MSHSLERRLVTLAHFADVMNVSPRTVKNWVSAGHVPVYKDPAKPSAFVDLDEARATILELNERGVVRLNYGSFGPKAKVVSLDGAR